MKGIFAIAFAIVGTAAYCQQSAMHGWGLESSYNQLYNAQSETTIKGRVVKISQRAPEAGMSPATTIILKQANGKTVPVDLGPEWFIKNQRRHLAVNDRVSVAGSQVDVNQKVRLMARKVTLGTHVLYLRELTGYPLWVASRPHVDTLALSPQQQAVASNEPNSREAASTSGPVAIATTPPPPPVDQASKPAADGKTMQGTIQRTVAVQNPQTGQIEEYLVVTTPTGTINVDIGPQWYQQQQDVNWAPGSNVVMSGIPGTPVATLPNFGNPIILPSGIAYGPQYMILRNGALSVWNAWY